jgi:hypothetical protein
LPGVVDSLFLAKIPLQQTMYKAIFYRLMLSRCVLALLFGLVGKPRVGVEDYFAMVVLPVVQGIDYKTAF